MSNMPSPYPEYKADVIFCKKVHKKYGKTFYAGSLLLPKEQKEASWILYAFFRYPDEIVDTEFNDDHAAALKKLQQWINDWKKIRDGSLERKDTDEYAVLRAACFIFSKYSIPEEYADAFLSAMSQDAEKERYATYAELEQYMYGSASVVGLMMSYVMCANLIEFKQDLNFRNDVLDGAKALGEALQMTNFLRDVGEDIRDRKRIYLPQEDMKKFSVTDEDIIKANLNENIKTLIKSEIKKTRELYLKGNRAIELLPIESRKAIRAASVVYSKILNKIEKADYDVFSKRARVSQSEKMYYVFLVLIGVNLTNI